MGGETEGVLFATNISTLLSCLLRINGGDSGHLVLRTEKKQTYIADVHLVLVGVKKVRVSSM